MSEFSIIIVSYFNGNEIFDTLNAALKQKGATEIIIVNNGNKPELVKKITSIASENKKIKFIEAGGNIGFGAGCNLGAQNASAPHLIFLNPDAVLEENALALLVPNDLSNVLIGGMVKNPDGSEQRGARRGELTILSALISFAGLGKIGEAAGAFRDFNRNREPLPENPIEVANISGAFFAISHENFLRLNGFDTSYFLHVEDIDLCKRFRDLGGKVYFNPNAHATHIGGTAGAPKAFVEWHKYQSFMRYFWRNYRGIGKIAVALIALPLYLAIMGRLVLKRRGES